MLGQCIDVTARIARLVRRSRGLGDERPDRLVVSVVAQVDHLLVDHRQFRPQRLQPDRHLRESPFDQPVAHASDAGIVTFATADAHDVATVPRVGLEPTLDGV